MSKITVHDFVAVGSASSSRAALQLEQGRDLVVAYSSTNRWVTPQSTIDPSAFTSRRGRLYQYRHVPPPLTSGIGSVSIPEWGKPFLANDPDHFRLPDLPDFESTDFQTSLMRPGRETAPSRHEKRIQDDGSTVDEPAKRPRLENATISNLIPEQRLMLFPPVIFQPVDTTKIPHYTKALPVPVAPYDTAAVDQLLSCRFGRGAWLIPVRGSLPCDGASTAVVLEDTQAASRSPSPCPVMSAAEPRVIAWTPDALQHFWDFLGKIQQAKHLGPVSFSFRAADADAFSTGDTVSEPLCESNRPYYPQYSSQHTTVSLDDFAADTHKAQLESVHYIKVYHDTPYSLSLRNVLDAYRYEQVDGQLPSRSGANDRKIRILKGARLVFMDELCKAVFLM